MLANADRQSGPTDKLIWLKRTSGISRNQQNGLERATPELMTQFTTFELNHERLVEAFPLVRMALPGIDQERWLAHCYSMIGRAGGVLAAAPWEGAIQGVATYRPDDDLRLGRVLRVEMLVTLELSAANPARAVLCEALESLCLDHDACGIALSVPVRSDGAEGFPESWERAGFRRQALLVCKSARPPRPEGPHLRLVEPD